MPKYRPTADDEDLYGDVKPPGAKPAPAPANADPNAPPKPGETGEPKDAETTDEETAESKNSAVVSNKVLTGPDGEPLKEGDEITVQIVRNFGDESEIRYAPKKTTGPEDGSMMSDANGEIDAMDTGMS